ncbi:MAG: phospho-sugar mutase [Arachnia sp.]
MSAISQAREWLAADPDPDTRAYLSQLLAQAADPARHDDAMAQLGALFAGRLEFGTAGLRGKLGPGPSRMNRVVVGQAAAGFGRWLMQQGLGGGAVIVGFDARWKSDEFATETARLLTGMGFRVLLTEEPTPTPIVAFGIQHFGCVAGIVVTASHNPPQDNGYKVYLGDGSQIVPPADHEISEHIGRITPAELAGLPRAEDAELLGECLLSAYVAHATTLVEPKAPRQVRWVHSAMHGVGAQPIRDLADACGFPPPDEVPQQAEPDPEFPTVAFPNPEEAGAIDLSLALAQEVGADVVIANDPDADRCAVAAPIDGVWRMLTGDELGALLGEDAIRRGAPGVLANSVVSSTLLGRMAAASGREHKTTLTGFKWIGRVPDLAYGYEEAIGYCVDPSAVPDKDGLTAALAVLRITAELAAEGRTLADRLDEIVHTYGLHATSQLSRRVADLSIIAEAMARLRGAPPATLLGERVKVVDLADGGELPPTDAIELSGEWVHVVARPSGTEPKLKCYLEVRLSPEDSADPSEARAIAADLLAELSAQMATALGI